MPRQPLLFPPVPGELPLEPAVVPQDLWLTLTTSVEGGATSRTELFHRHHDQFVLRHNVDVQAEELVYQDHIIRPDEFLPIHQMVRALEYPLEEPEHPPSLCTGYLLDVSNGLTTVSYYWSSAADESFPLHAVASEIQRLKQRYMGM